MVSVFIFKSDQANLCALSHITLSGLSLLRLFGSKLFGRNDAKVLAERSSLNGITLAHRGSTATTFAFWEPRTAMRTPSRSKIDVATPDGVAELEALVNDRLSGQLANLEIVITADGIVLRGCTHTYHAQQLAAEVVEQLVTVPIAANEIEVLQGSERIPAFPMRPRAASCAHDGD